MKDIYESKILLKGANFKEGDALAEFSIKVNFGTKKCTKKMDRLKEMGIEDGSNIVFIMHECYNDEDAKSIVELLEGLKEIIPFFSMMEKVFSDGNNVMIVIRLPAEILGPLTMLEPMAKYMGDFASQKQFFELKIMNSRSFEEIFNNPSTTPLAMFIDALGIQISAALHKDLPIKIFNFIESLDSKGDEQLKLIGQLMSTFHHLNVELELRDLPEMVKGAYKEIMGDMTSYSVGKAFSFAEQFNATEILKKTGGTTTGYLILSPLIMTEVRIYGPTAISTLEKIAASH